MDNSLLEYQIDEIVIYLIVLLSFFGCIYIIVSKIFNFRLKKWNRIFKKMNLKSSFNHQGNFWTREDFMIEASGIYKDKKILIINNYSSDSLSGNPRAFLRNKQLSSLSRKDLMGTQVFVDDKIITNFVGATGMTSGVIGMISPRKVLSLIDRYIENPTKYYQDFKKQYLLSFLAYFLIFIITFGALLYAAYFNS